MARKFMNLTDIETRITELKQEQEALVQSHNVQAQAWQEQANKNQARANEIVGALKELEALKE